MDAAGRATRNAPAVGAAKPQSGKQSYLTLPMIAHTTQRSWLLASTPRPGAALQALVNTHFVSWATTSQSIGSTQILDT